MATKSVAHVMFACLFVVFVIIISNFPSTFPLLMFMHGHIYFISISSYFIHVFP